MRDIFHHVYEVQVKDGKYIPRRFSEKSMEALGKILPRFKENSRCPAGISLKFYTDAEEITFDYKYNTLYTPEGGFDVYEQGQMVRDILLPMGITEIP